MLSIILIIFVSAFTQGLTGFGSSLVSIPLLLLLLDAKVATPLMGLLGVTMNTILFIYLRDNFDRPRLLPLIISSFAGIPIGIILLKNAPQSSIKQLLAVIIISYLIYCFAKPTIINRQLPVALTWLIGFGAGCLSGAINTNGPLVVPWATWQGWTKQEFRGNLQAYFTITGIVAVSGYGAIGLITNTVLHYYLIGLPCLLIGLVMGDRASTKLNQQQFTKIVQIGLVLMAVILLIP